MRYNLIFISSKYPTMLNQRQDIKIVYAHPLS